MKVAITYARSTLNGVEGPPETKVLSIVLKKVKGIGE